MNKTTITTPPIIENLINAAQDLAAAHERIRRLTEILGEYADDANWGDRGGHCDVWLHPTHGTDLAKLALGEEVKTNHPACDTCGDTFWIYLFGVGDKGPESLLAACPFCNPNGDKERKANTSALIEDGWICEGQLPKKMSVENYDKWFAQSRAKEAHAMEPFSTRVHEDNRIGFEVYGVENVLSLEDALKLRQSLDGAIQSIQRASKIDTPFKLIHIQPFKGWEIIGEFDTQEAAETRKAELLVIAPEEWLAIANVRPPAHLAAQQEGRDEQSKTTTS